MFKKLFFLLAIGLFVLTACKKDNNNNNNKKKDFVKYLTSTKWLNYQNITIYYDKSGKEVDRLTRNNLNVSSTFSQIADLNAELNMYVDRFAESGRPLESYKWTLGFEEKKFTINGSNKGFFQNVTENGFEVHTKWNGKEDLNIIKYDYIYSVDYYKR